MVQQLANKVAIVTGAGSGKGQAIAELFAKQGAQVVAADSNTEALKAVVDGINAAGGTAIAAVTDVTKDADVTAMVQRAVDQFGRLDILVNNAGMLDKLAPADTLTNELWDRVMTVNTTSVMLATREALKRFTTQDAGVILNIAAVEGDTSDRASAAYAASKHAVVGLTKNTAFMYQNAGIRTNAIAPGNKDTESPLGITVPTMPSGNKIAQTALFLCSDAASYVNGVIVPVKF
ncbi:SDR family NAD(P)-dependent oxidoreductase [Levilactobacillus sp. N40-8-2]|uniref:SDR family NAD(P)-dependent oxidoreductase n=1 Tax=Levilactobacillus muriae TaxID=3238987 RepID=UPI0038B340A1